MDVDFRSKQWLDKVETTPPHAPVLPHQKTLKSSNSHKQLSFESSPGVMM